MATSLINTECKRYGCIKNLLACYANCRYSTRCDDLKNEVSYSDATDRKFYNAVLAVPIRHSDAKSLDKDPLGILSLESQNGIAVSPLFEGNQDCLFILTHAAAQLANFILSVTLYQAHTYPLRH